MMLYCMVLPEGYTKAYWYIADYEARIGDYVEIPVRKETKIGYIIQVLACTKKTAPFPVNDTKHIIQKCEFGEESKKLSQERMRVLAQERQKRKIEIQEIHRKAIIHRKSQERAERMMSSFLSSIEVVPFVPDDSIQEVFFKDDDRFSFCSAVFRGFEADVKKACTWLREKCQQEGRIYIQRIKFQMVAKEICEFEVDDSEHIKLILQHYPQLKAAIFVEDWFHESVHIAYSPSGYPYITDMNMIGYFDGHDMDRWYFNCSPAEREVEASFVYLSSGGRENIRYEFDFIDDWEAANYVIIKDEIKQKIVRITETDEFTIEDNKDETGTIIAYNGNAVELSIPQIYDGLLVKGVEFRARTKKQSEVYAKIESITFPEGCQFVGGCYGFFSLKRIELPRSLKEILPKAFMRCEKLNSIIMYDDICHIGHEAFSKCKSLNEFRLPAHFSRSPWYPDDWLFKDSGIKKLYVCNVTINPNESNWLKGCTDYVIYAPPGSPFFTNRKYERYTEQYQPDNQENTYSKEDMTMKKYNDEEYDEEEYDEEYEEEYEGWYGPDHDDTRDIIEAYYEPVEFNDEENKFFAIKFNNLVLEGILKKYNYKSEMIEDIANIGVSKTIAKYVGVKTIEDLVSTLTSLYISLGKGDNGLEEELIARKKEIADGFSYLEGTSAESTKQEKLTDFGYSEESYGEELALITQGYDFSLKKGIYKAKYRWCEEGW